MMKKSFIILFFAMLMAWPVAARTSGLQVDVNGDGSADIEDVTTLISIALGQTTADADLAVDDVNCDGVADIEDVACLIEWLLSAPEPQNQHVTITVNGVDFTMLFVEGGTFMMGCTPEQWPGVFRNEGPVHEVTLWSYYIAQTEVTQELWEAVMGYNPSKFVGDLQRPVETVSMFDCALFVDKLSELTGKTFRLPTEAEWEYAARGGNRSLTYRLSGSNTIDDVAWYEENGEGMTHPVASKQANELGIYDMSGNVNEWCQDWYAIYPEGPVTNPIGPESGYENVYRGGCWAFPECRCRNAFRDEAEPNTANKYLGLRIAMNF